MKRILAADIGGTNARFAAFTVGEGQLLLQEDLWFDSAGATSFADVLGRLPKHGPLSPAEQDIVALAVAGPVRDGVYCKPPNLQWDVDISSPQALGFERAVMCNDFEAQAYAVKTDAMRHAYGVLAGRESAGAVAVIGAGTGLGKAALVPDGSGGWNAMPTEGGHALFPFEGEREFAFQRFVAERAGRTQVIGDMVLSGSGLVALHAFLTGEELDAKDVAQRFDKQSQTLEWFARFYGRACRDFALSVLATGGVVIAGGVAGHNPCIVKHGAFRTEFLRSETHAELLSGIGVRLNTEQRSGLYGAAYYGAKALGG